VLTPLMLPKQHIVNYPELSHGFTSSWFKLIDLHDVHFQPCIFTWLNMYTR